MYELPEKGDIIFKICNVLGEKVYEISEKNSAGTNQVKFNVKNWKPGVYFYSVEYNNKRLIRKMVIVK